MFSLADQKLATEFLNRKSLNGVSNNKMWPRIVKATGFLPDNTAVSRRLWHVANDTKAIPICSCGKPVNWDRDTQKYRKFCSLRCMANDQETQEKKKETSLKNFGTENPMLAESVKARQQKSLLKNHGVDNPMKSDVIRDTHRKNMLEAHGVDNPSRMEGNAEKIRRTSEKVWGVPHFAKSSEVQGKRTGTNRRLYGTDYPVAQSPEIREKARATWKRKYGVENPMQAKEVQDKARKTNRAKYGQDTYPQSRMAKGALECLTNKEWMRKQYVQLGKTYTQIAEDLGVAQSVVGVYATQVHGFQTRVYQADHIPREVIRKIADKDWLHQQHWEAKKSVNDIAVSLSVSPHIVYSRMSNLGIDIRTDPGSISESEIRHFISRIFKGEISTNSRKIIPPCEIDIFVPPHKLAIEFHGLYWHNEQHIPDREYHLNKFKRCAAKGIRLIQIFENEWLHKRRIVESILVSILGTTSTISAQECRVAKVNTKTQRWFLGKYHIQGYAPAKVAYGLVHEERLVGLMTFGGHAGEDCAWELSRFCTKVGVSVVGGERLLFEHFRSNHKGQVVAYCDLRWDTVDMYEELGFVQVKTSAPDYWYVVGNQLVHRSGFPELDTLEFFDPELTEYQNMLANGYDRIWDCGSAVYVCR